MASKESSSSTSDGRNEPHTYLFGIDLNEIPSTESSDLVGASEAMEAYEAVKRVCGNVNPFSGGPAELPSGLSSWPCVCGRVDAKGSIVVCDGCERWYHLKCVGLPSKGSSVLDDWVCGTCLIHGVKSKRWPLGLVSLGTKSSGVRLLDINALPPSEGDEELLQSQSPRAYTLRGNYPTGIPLNVPVVYSNAWNVENGFGLQTDTGILMHPIISGIGGLLRQTMMTNMNHQETETSSSGRIRTTNNAPVKRKRLARLSKTNNLIENHEQLSGGDFISDVEMVDRRMFDFMTNARVAEAESEGICGNTYQQLNDGVPIQFADFFVLSLGEIDRRATYHNSTQIFPVGYRSCCHDKLTGSIFMCDVLDGGDSGPIFKVTRFPCSQLLIPNASTVLSRQNLVQLDAQDKVKISAATITSDIGFEADDDIQMYLFDPSLLDQNILSIVGSGLSESFNQSKVGLPPQLNCEPERSGKLLSKNSCLGDEIGEFFAEARSSSLVWAKVSETIGDACHEIFMHTGSLQFYCKHEIDGTCSSYSDAEIGRKLDSLAKLCNSCGPITIPSVIRSVDELETACKALTKWLNQDRFGLDMEFVQEVIEKLPGSRACSKYEFLNSRRNFSILQTVGSGYLMAKRKSNERSEGYEGLYAANGKHKRSRKNLVQGPEINVRPPPLPPQGKPLNSKIPEKMVGDVIQIWEFLWRFYEILGMKEPLSLEELQKEIIDPWFDGQTFLEKIEKEIQESRDRTSDGSDGGTFVQTLSSRSESGLAILGENPPKFITVEIGPWKEGYEARLASGTYNRCTGVSLTKAHSSLLKVVVGELQAKIAAIVDRSFDSGDSKSRRGRKKDIDNSIALKVSKIDILPINALTWPELARRYILAISFMDGNLDSSDITSREGVKVIRCLQGDGGVICGSLTGLTGMEADAVLIAEATKQISGSQKRENDIFPVEYKVSEAVVDNEMTSLGGNIPEWAQLLEPVKKLPTNVGTRIRNCVKNALDKDPPEWAREILEHSISKEVYKGNASGPTKKAVQSVLAQVCGEGPTRKPKKVRKAGKTVKTLSDVIMKQCRSVLRFSAVADDARVFCNLLATTSSNPNDNEDEGILGSPAMVSRPLDFRTVDLRLAVGAYGGSHDAFLEDVREVWRNIQTAYADRPELMQLAETLSKSFESSYEKEVLTLIQAYREHASNPEFLKKELTDALVRVNKIPKAPWDDGVCKVCGVDKDDESVLLCDTCDSEYHTYCLNPPLARIPEGNWYCPSCVAGQTTNNKDASRYPWVTSRGGRKKHSRGDNYNFSEALNRLAVTMEKKEYWDFSVEERIILLKFLCDEVLNSSLIREHLDKCANISGDLQQKFRSLTSDHKILKDRYDILAKRGMEDPWRSYPESVSEKHCNGIRTENMKPSDTGPRAKDVSPVMDGNLLHEGPFAHMVSLKKDESNRGSEQHLSTSHQKVIEDSNGELNLGCNLNGKYGISPDFNGSDTNDPQSYVVEANSLKNEMLLLQDSIASIESQLLKVSMRRDLLGRDSSGRMYWVLGRRGKSPCLVVDLSTTQQKMEMTGGMGPTADSSCSIFLYESDTEIQDLVRWFNDSDTREKELKDSILQLRSTTPLDSQQAGKLPIDSEKTEPLISLVTKAVIVLEKKYGPCVEPETSEIPKKRGRKAKLTEEDRMYRCECLELVWPSRQHCLSCHQTFCTRLEYERHNDEKCSSDAVAPDDSKDNDEPSEMDKIEESKNEKFEVMSRLVKFQKEEEVCPYNLEDIRSAFITKDSNKELVQQIGLIGSNGIPSLVPTMSPYLHDPTLVLCPKQNGDSETGVTHTDLEIRSGVLARLNGNDITSYSPKGYTWTGTGEEAFKVEVSNANSRNPLSSPNRSQELDNCCIIPESSLKPLVGKVSQILRLLKINLLDMDAALPEEALRPSKAHSSSRCAWRAFVKSGDSILEMIKAAIVFEDMIKTEYLRNGWWYWSSLSAAARTSTISSLSLRIYALDSAIAYEKSSLAPDVTPPTPPTDNPRPSKKMKETEG
ncbi:hypothetical protein GIB67_016554 [Kingdonia uniflora]|uniref:PHD-type domain-containing protein n=1 Tax=Kingdonia uniflora TaxID=39325 RepID=A0A7J7NR02_9MAGN|nr:hypothetical protein GIB67_016554 [Kingdonia uniflora]